MDERAVHPAKAPGPIVVQAAGSRTVVSEVHPAKQSDGISAMDVLRRLTTVIVVLPAKAPSARVETVTDEDSWTDVVSDEV